jgi:O-succinylbenzoate synthase
MESSVGLAAGVALARAIPVLEGIDRAHGLGTGALLASDTVARSLVPIGGRISNVKLEVTA